MKKRIALVLTLVLFLSVSSSRVFAMPLSSDGDSVKVTGAFIQSKFKAGGMYGTIIDSDYYLDVRDARTLANKISMSNAQTVAWTAAAMTFAKIPYVGTGLANATTIVGLANGIYRGNVASSIRKYTDKNKKVHVLIEVGANGIAKVYKVSSWNGKVSSIRATHVSGLNASYFKIKTTKYRYKKI